MLPAVYTPSTTAVGDSLTITALLGLLPLLLFFVMLGAFKVATHWCALGALVVALAVGSLAYGMPFGLSLLSASQGAVFGLLVICYIVVAAVWLYQLTEVSGRAADMRAVFSLVGKGDTRVQALLISFCFCGLMEGLAGFGAPVAITCAMLLALGLPPLKAALLTMVGNSLNVAFGAMAIPMITTARLGGVTEAALTNTASRITPMFLIWIPLVLVAMVDGFRGVRQLWPVAIVAGAGMGAGHLIATHFLSFELTAVIGSLISFILAALFLLVWTPKTPDEQRSAAPAVRLTGQRVGLALLPYIFVVVVFAIAKMWRIGVDIPAALKSTDIPIPWPGLDGNLLTAAGEVSKDTIFNLSTISSPGTMLLLSALVVNAIYAAASPGGPGGFTFAKGIATLGATLKELRLAILTIAAVMALAYAMNFSGQTVAIGTWLAATGAAFAFFAPFLGWLGTAVTGSATSAGALFANLHAAAAQQANLSPQLLLAVNEIGGGTGKIVSPQNLAIAATAVKADGMEAELLRKAAPYSLGFAAILGVITVLASVGILGFVIAS